MTWHFRGALSHIEIRQGDRLLLPFAGCAWLAGSAGTGEAPVFDAYLEIVRRDDLLVQAVRDDAAEIARRTGTEDAAGAVDGCIYCLGKTVRLLAGVSGDTMATIQRSLLAPLPSRHFFVNLEIDFAGFDRESDRIDAATVSRRAFLEGRRAIHFAGCRLSVGFDDWPVEPGQLAGRRHAIADEARALGF